MYGQQPPPNPYQQPMYGQQPPPYGQMTKPAGQTMIRVTGILLIIFGAIGALIGFVAVDEVTNPGPWVSYPSSLENLVVFELIVSIVMLIGGIVATAGASKKSSAPAVITFGVILLALRIIYTFWAMDVVSDLNRMAGFDLLSEGSIVFGLALGLPLPILLLVGGNKRRNAED
jgi:hypothetical protein